MDSDTFNLKSNQTQPVRNTLPNGKTLTITPATKRSTRNAVTLKQQGDVRIAAYVRVSTDELDQQNSFENQANYYRDYIAHKDGWILAGIYSDEGISGMSIKGRDGFNRMIADAKAGKFEYIITKSISRFSRNTIDGLTTVNELRNLDPPIGVYFEKEGLDTMEKGCEFLLSIMMSMAQGESDSIGENIQWTYRKKFAEGDPLLKADNFYGFKSGENGAWDIDEEQAKVVRRIYDLYISGAGTQKIANILTNDGILTPRGKSQWHSCTIHSILKNEKYKGDVQMQKYVTVDRKTKRSKKNTGEAKSYYLENHHKAIVSKEIWDEAQKILESKKKFVTAKRDSKGHFSLKKVLACGDCGAALYSKTIKRIVKTDSNTTDAATSSGSVTGAVNKLLTKIFTKREAGFLAIRPCFLWRLCYNLIHSVYFQVLKLLCHEGTAIGTPEGCTTSLTEATRGRTFSRKRMIIFTS